MEDKMKRLEGKAEEIARELKEFPQPRTLRPEMLLETCLLDLYRDDRDFDLSAERGEDDRRES
jgi:hypothetical protein